MIENLGVIDPDQLTAILYVASQIPKLTKPHTRDIDDLPQPDKRRVVSLLNGDRKGTTLMTGCQRLSKS